MRNAEVVRRIVRGAVTLGIRETSPRMGAERHAPNRFGRLQQVGLMVLLGASAAACIACESKCMDNRDCRAGQVCVDKQGSEQGTCKAR